MPAFALLRAPVVSEPVAMGGFAKYLQETGESTFDSVPRDARAPAQRHDLGRFCSRHHSTFRPCAEASSRRLEGLTREPRPPHETGLCVFLSTTRCVGPPTLSKLGQVRSR